jgi:hypothetical protein
MDDVEQTEQHPVAELHRRDITLPDGRYLIFYTFDASDAASPGTEKPSETGETGV